MDLLLRNGLKKMAYIFVIFFSVLGMVAAVLLPFSLDHFLCFYHVWLVTLIVLLLVLCVFSLVRKIGGSSDGRSPKSILELARLRSLTTAGSENLSDVVASSQETWFDFIWKQPPWHAKCVAEGYGLVLLPTMPEETDPPTPDDVPLLEPPPPRPPANAPSFDEPSAPSYDAAYGDIPPSPVHAWYDVPSSPAPYSPTFAEVPPSPAYHPAYDDFPPSPVHTWHDVPSSPYIPRFCDVPSSPAANYSRHDVPSSPAAYDYDPYDHIPYSPTNASAVFPSRSSPYEVEPEALPSEVEKDVVEPWDRCKPLFDRYWSEIPSPRPTHTAASVDFSFHITPSESEPSWPPEVRKEMVHPWHDDGKSIDETWNSIVVGGRSLAKSLRRQLHREERGHGAAANKGATEPATRKGPKKTSSKEVAAVASRKKPQRAEKSSRREAKTPKKETGWGEMPLLVVDREKEDELFQRAEMLIKKQYNDFKVQRVESMRRRREEKLRLFS